MDQITLILLTLAALLTSLLSGIVGMAGGITLLGVMSALLPPALVVPLHGVVQLASNSTRTLVFMRHVVWRIFGIYALPFTAGIWLATQVWSGDKLDWFKPVIGIFILAFLVWRQFKPQLRNLPLWSFAPVGLVVGFAAIFIGATGPLTAPFYLRDELANEEVIATKAMCQSYGHLLKIPAFLSLGFDFTPHWQSLLALLLAVVVGTTIAKWTFRFISKEVFTVIYQVVLALIAVYLIVAGLTG